MNQYQIETVTPSATIKLLVDHFIVDGTEIIGSNYSDGVLVFSTDVTLTPEIMAHLEIRDY